MEDLQSKFVAGVISLVLAAAAWLKSHTEVKDIKADREKTKNERDTKIALLEQKVEILEKQRKEDAERYEKQLLDIVTRFEKRLSEGNDRFEKVEQKIDETNKNVEQTNHILGEIKGALMNSGLVFSGTPVIRRSGHTPEKEPL